MNPLRKKSAGQCLKTLAVIAVLAAAVAVIYAQTRSFGFVNFDDDIYVLNNRHVRNGLSWPAVRWAFTARYAATWQPLTWLSYMAVSHPGGPRPGWEHLINAGLHLANAALLLLFLQGATRAPLRSALVAMLFAIHPIHVESVAWIAERKDVLSTLFMMLTLLAYLRYSRRRSAAAYLGVLLLYLPGLMAKPVLVTLPFVLLLLDWWPLGRRQCGAARLIAEKAPLLLCAAGSSVVTVLVQKQGGALASFTLCPVAIRISNAAVSYVRYIAKLLWPADLAVMYPLTAPPAPWLTAGALLALASLSALLWRRRGSSPYLLMGWLWYLGTMLPMIGLVQIGTHAMADRFAYIPFIGLYIGIVWGGAALKPRSFRLSACAAVAVVLTLLALIYTARRQASRWADSKTLFQHALAVTEGNFVAHNNLAGALKDEGDYAAALRHIKEACRLAPDFADARSNLASLLYLQGQKQQALKLYYAALRLKPESADLHYNVGVILLEQGNTSEAIKCFTRALDRYPQYAEALSNRGAALIAQGDYHRALEDLDRALGTDPHFAGARYNRGRALLAAGRYRAALADLDAAAGHAEIPGAALQYYRALALLSLGECGPALAAGRRAAAEGYAVGQDFLTKMQACAAASAAQQ